jgi:arylsulfatase A-like enzyme
MKPRVSLGIFSCLALVSCTAESRIDGPPNIVYILADDLGYGDLSCYGQKKFSTPNIDRLAAEGMLFTQHYAGCTVSAPSRSSLMTGLHTGHTPIRGNKAWIPEGQWPLPDSSVTIAEILKSRGYVTGAFGKWGLGFIGTEGDPNDQGFDNFFGYNCQGLAHNYYPYYLWHNQEKIVLPENSGTGTGTWAPDIIQEKALEFIENNRDKPFFLFYPNVIPHAELFAPEEYMNMFRGKFLPEKSYIGIDSGPRFRLGPYGSQPESHAAFAAMVTRLDDYVGEITAKLKELGLEKNTIVMFTSDNGPHLEGGADPDYFDSNGPLKGYKRDLYEGGIRTPFLVKWPGKVRPGSGTDHISAFWDVLPTIAEITGAEITVATDGISFLPTLLGKDQKQHQYLYWEFHEQGGKAALRMGNWKAVKRDIEKLPHGETELYDLQADIGETNNVAALYPDIVKKIDSLLIRARVRSQTFPFSCEVSPDMH